MATYRRIGFTPNSVTYSNPSDFSDTAKATVIRKPKNVGQSRLTNVATTLKLNRRVEIPAPEQEGCCIVPQFEDLAMSFTSSGSVENITQLGQMKTDMIYLINLWFDDVTAGFLPLETSPVLPAA